MRRRLFNIATVLSLLLLLAVSVLWPVSIFYDDRLFIRWARLQLSSHSGVLWLAIKRYTNDPTNFYRKLVNVPLDELRWLPHWGAAQFVVGNIKLYHVTIPYWMLWLASAILPTLWLRRWRKKSGQGFPVQTSA